MKSYEVVSATSDGSVHDESLSEDLDLVLGEANILSSELSLDDRDSSVVVSDQRLSSDGLDLSSVESSSVSEDGFTTLGDDVSSDNSGLSSEDDNLLSNDCSAFS